jgi:hypothetical protein
MYVCMHRMVQLWQQTVNKQKNKMGTFSGLHAEKISWTCTPQPLSPKPKLSLHAIYIF